VRKVIFATLCVVVIGVFTTPVEARPTTAGPGLPTDPEALIAPGDPGTDQMIVHLAGRVTPASADLPLSTGDSPTGVRKMTDGGWVVKLPETYSAPAARQLALAWEAQGKVVSAEPDVRMFAEATPNDPKYGVQWDLGTATAVSYSANLPGAWDLSKGSADVVTAVVDTGYTDHEDLNGRFLPGYDFIDNTAVANDGGGRDNDAHDPGDWVTAAESADVNGQFHGCSVRNSEWHGSHVAGTIGASSNNGVGVAGINWVSKILPVRVLGKCGGYTSDIVDAIRWAAGLTVAGVPANPNPADIINLSLGAEAGCGSTWQVAIDDVTAADVLVVAAAGNDNSDAAGHAPSSCSDVLSVAATARSGNKASYSNYGTRVDISAPGGDASDTKIWSTVTTGGTGPGTSGYAAYQGTSMAAPHVAGVASLIKSVFPTATRAQIKAFLVQNATPFPAGGTCNTVTCGIGVVNAAAAVAAAYAYGPPGYLRVVTSPPVPSMITTDYVPRDEFGLNWINATPGVSHDVCFGPVPGFITPPCQSVVVLSNATTTVTGTFVQQGYLSVVTDPPVASTISIDNTPVNEYGAWVPTTAGSHTVCFGAVAGFDAPACQTVSVTAGATTTATGSFIADPNATGPAAGYGFLRVTTNPPVGAQVVVDNVARDSWGLNWLKIAPGSHSVCFAPFATATGPACQTVTVTAGATSSVEGAFTLKGSLRAVTSPALNASISVDGPLADNYGVWRTVPVGTHTVCWGQVTGYKTPTSCPTVTVTAGQTATATYTYTPN